MFISTILGGFIVSHMNQGVSIETECQHQASWDDPDHHNALPLLTP